MKYRRAKLYADRVAPIERGYFHLQVKDLWTAESMACPIDTDTGIYASRLAKSVTCSIKDILSEVEASGQQYLASPTWAAGWEAHLHKCMREAIHPKPATDANRRTGRRHRLRNGGSSTLRRDTVISGLVRDLTSDFDRTAQRDAVKKLSSFVVPNGCLFADSLRDFKALVSAVEDSGFKNAPTDGMVHSCVHDSVSTQSPSTLSSLFPASLAVREPCYASVDAM